MSASMLFGKRNWGWGGIVTCTGDFLTSRRPWFEEGQWTTAWRIGSLGNTLWCDNASRIWRFWLYATKLHKTTTAKVSARPFGPRHLPLSSLFHESTTQSSARPCGPCLSSVASAQPPIFRRRCLPRGLGRAALDSDHAECTVSPYDDQWTIV